MTTYLVKSGDSLSKIARDVLGDITRWPEIQQLNHLANPNLITPGQVLQLPEVITQDNRPIPGLDSQAASPQQSAGAKAFPWGTVLLLVGLLGVGYGVYRKSQKKKESI